MKDPRLEMDQPKGQKRKAKAVKKRDRQDSNQVETETERPLRQRTEETVIVSESSEDNMSSPPQPNPVTFSQNVQNMIARCALADALPAEETGDSAGDRDANQMNPEAAISEAGLMSTTDTVGPP